MYVHIHPLTHGPTPTYAYTHIPKYTHPNTRTSSCAHTYAHTFTTVHTQTHTHTHTPWLPPPFNVPLHDRLQVLQSIFTEEESPVKITLHNPIDVLLCLIKHICEQSKPGIVAQYTTMYHQLHPIIAHTVNTWTNYHVQLYHWHMSWWTGCTYILCLTGHNYLGFKGEIIHNDVDWSLGSIIIHKVCDKFVNFKTIPCKGLAQGTQHIADYIMHLLGIFSNWWQMVIIDYINTLAMPMNSFQKIRPD